MNYLVEEDVRRLYKSGEWFSPVRAARILDVRLDVVLLALEKMGRDGRAEHDAGVWRVL